VCLIHEFVKILNHKIICRLWRKIQKQFAFVNKRIIQNYLNISLWRKPSKQLRFVSENFHKIGQEKTSIYFWKKTQIKQKNKHILSQKWMHEQCRVTWWLARKSVLTKWYFYLCNNTPSHAIVNAASNISCTIIPPATLL
jgi:hypothetical protein